MASKATAAKAETFEAEIIEIGLITESKSNTRSTYDEQELADLAASIRAQGVLQPVIVRKSGKGYELVAGSRRLRASKLAEKSTIPAIVRVIGDEQLTEIQLIENLQRADVHAMDEAMGYQRLAKKGRAIADIAAKVGKSEKYVYDRIKLLSLIPDAQTVFKANIITAGHAILLARLKPADQKRALAVRDRWGKESGGLLETDAGLFDEKEEKGKFSRLKSVSVREFERWINEHVKLEANEVDQMVMPETAATLAKLAEEKVTVLRVTHDTMTAPELKDGKPVILGRGWKRADGQERTKKCDHARPAMVVMGEGRGAAFNVCVNKKKCATHWPDHVKAAKAATKAGAQAASKGKNAAAAERERYEAEREKQRFAQEAENKRWARAEAPIFAALAAAIDKDPVTTASAVGKLVLERLGERRRGDKAVAGKDAAAIVRYLCKTVVFEDHLNYEYPRRNAIENGKLLGVDVKKILDTEAPPEPKAKPEKAAKKPAAKRAVKK